MSSNKNATRARYPLSSIKERKKKSKITCGKNERMLPTPPIIPVSTKSTIQAMLQTLLREETICPPIMSWTRVRRRFESHAPSEKKVK